MPSFQDKAVFSGIFLNQVHGWFLEIAFVCNFGMSYVSVCLSLCVRPQGYKLHSHDIKPVQPVEQVCYI